MQNARTATALPARRAGTLRTGRQPWSYLVWPLLIVLFVGTSSVRPAAAAGPDKKVTNADVIELHKMGLGSEVVLQKIRGSSCAFDTSIDALRQLKKAGVPEPVITEMLRVSQGGPAPAVPAEAAINDPNNPLAPHEPGVYYLDESQSAARMLAVEPTVYAQAKAGGRWKSVATAGISKIKSKAVLSGAGARLRIADRRPTFFFYFEAKGSGLGSPQLPFAATATSPNEFALIRLEVKERSRETVVGQFNAWGSAQAGVMDKAVVPFDLEKLAPGSYKVRPTGLLENGEYCFMYSGSAPQATYGYAGPQGIGGGGGKVFDFGILAQ